jgi:ABC-type sugar transport system ATPase subunit
MAEIRIEHLHKRFGDFIAVEDSSLTVKNGEFFVLLGLDSSCPHRARSCSMGRT